MRGKKFGTKIKELGGPLEAVAVGGEVLVRRLHWERMWKIHGLLEAGKYPNAQSLAADWEISEKTIRRYIDFMRDIYQAPIVFDAHKNGYYYERPVKNFLGMVMLSTEEMSALLVARDMLAQCQGPFGEEMEGALRKVSVGGESEAGQTKFFFRLSAPEIVDGKVFKEVKRGAEEKRTIEYRYRKPGQTGWSERELCPYGVAYLDGRWYAVGQEVGKTVVKLFAIGRMSDLVVTEKRFEVPKDFSMEKFLKHALAAMAGTEGADYQVVVDMDPWLMDQMRGRVLHHSQRFTELPGGWVRMSLRLAALGEIERWVLGWGEHAVVVAPKALVDRVAEVHLHQAAVYRPQLQGIPPGQQLLL